MQMQQMLVVIGPDRQKARTQAPRPCRLRSKRRPCGAGCGGRHAITQAQATCTLLFMTYMTGTGEGQTQILARRFWCEDRKSSGRGWACTGFLRQIPKQSILTQGRLFSFGPTLTDDARPKTKWSTSFFARRTLSAIEISRFRLGLLLLRPDEHSSSSCSQQSSPSHSESTSILARSTTASASTVTRSSQEPSQGTQPSQKSWVVFSSC